MHRLYEIAQCPIELIWHENQTTYLSVLKKRGMLQLRVHCLFYDAPTPVLEALIRYAKTKDQKSRAVIKQMAHLYFSKHHISGRALKTKGEIYDLKIIFDQMRQRLPNTVFHHICIGWSVSKRVGKRSVTFGSFDPHRRQIRINPILDDEEVPQYFLEYVIYHEMLHAIYPSRINANGRFQIHTKEFREKERDFSHYQLAKEWESSFLKKRRQKHGRA